MAISYSAQTTVNRAHVPNIAVMRGAPKDGGFGPLEKLALRVDVAPGQAICREGDAATHCFRVVSGTVRLLKLTDDGRRQIAAFLGEGDLFGWNDGSAHRHTAEAVTHVVVARFERAKVEDAMTAYPALARRLLGAMAAQLAAAQEHLLLLGRKTAGERIASFFGALAARAKARTGADGIVMLPMTRIDIADYLGLTVETVSRMITWLKTERVITLLETDIVRIDDPATLAGLANAA
jgi:CRP/FNR family transcriptional regulator